MSDLSSILDIGGSTAAVTATSTTIEATSASLSSTSIASTSSSLKISTSATTANTASTSQESSSSTSTSSISNTSTTSSSSLTTSALNTPTTSSTFISSSSTSLIPTTSVLTSVNSSGGTETVTVVNSVTATASASPTSTTSAASGSSSSFFSNKGAVAGTFTVVGIIGAVILIWGMIYFVRRRRANQYDRESEEAALEAAHATVPVFLDDDDDRPTYGSYSNTGATYDAYEGGANHGLVPSASSHGTYAQPFMGLSSNENYPMAEFSSQYPGGSPYPAFMATGASPQHNNYFDYGYAGAEGHTSPPMNATRPLSGAYSIPEMSELFGGVDGAGNMGMSAANPSLNRGQSTLTTTGSHSQTDLSRNQSQGSRSFVNSYRTNNFVEGHESLVPTSNESYAAHYQPGFSRMMSSAAPSRRSTIAYEEASPLPNPFTKAVEDHNDNEEVQKILKVANE